MHLNTWLLFAATEAALCVSPGPAVLYVTSHALHRGFTTSVAASFGIVTGNVVYFALSALGVGALILATGELFTIIKWLGAAYLIWLGVWMWLGGGSPLGNVSRGARAAGRAWRGGVVVQLANPKNLVFFIAILPPFIDPDGNVPLQVLILGATSQVIEITVLLGYGALGTHAGQMLRESRFMAWIDRVAGAALISIGAALAFVRRTA